MRHTISNRFQCRTVIPDHLFAYRLVLIQYPGFGISLLPVIFPDPSFIHQLGFCLICAYLWEISDGPYRRGVLQCAIENQLTYVRCVLLGAMKCVATTDHHSSWIAILFTKSDWKIWSSSSSLGILRLTLMGVRETWGVWFVLFFDVSERLFLFCRVWKRGSSWSHRWRFCRVAESWACSVWPWNQGPRFSFFLCVCGSLFCCRVSYLWGTFIEASSGSYIHPGECGCYKLLMLYDSWWESETQNLEWWFLSNFLSKLTILVILGLGPRSTYNSNDERMCALCF